MIASTLPPNQPRQKIKKGKVERDDTVWIKSLLLDRFIRFYLERIVGADASVTTNCQRL
jgi:hypothetical protein